GINEHDNNGRNVAMKSILIALGLASALAIPAAAQDFGPPELIAAAKKEGRLVYYTANFAEVEQEVIKAFNKRFPEIKVEMVRAPGGQLITRIRQQANRRGHRALGRHDLDARHVRAAGAGRGLLAKAGSDQPRALSLRSADVGFARARRDHDGSA